MIPRSFRSRLGPGGCEKLLELTITAGLATQTVKPASFKQVTVDTTVQEKAIAFPTYGRFDQQRQKYGFDTPRVQGGEAEGALLEAIEDHSGNQEAKDDKENIYANEAARQFA